MQVVNPKRQHKIRSCTWQSCVQQPPLFPLPLSNDFTNPACSVEIGLQLVLREENVKYNLDLHFLAYLQRFFVKKLQTNSFSYLINQETYTYRIQVSLSLQCQAAPGCSLFLDTAQDLGSALFHHPYIEKKKWWASFGPLFPFQTKLKSIVLSGPRPPMLWGAQIPCEGLSSPKEPREQLENQSSTVQSQS